MKIALCTTTINVPTVLKLYRACDPDVRFFVAVDKKTSDGCYDFITDLQDSETYAHGTEDWKCSIPIGWNTLSRRNIAFLEALKWGAEVVVSVDDDNIPMELGYFADFNSLFFPIPYTKGPVTFNGFLASSKDGWFDAGQMLNPWAKHRGIPHGRHVHIYHSVTNAKVGVAAGLCLGDPDIDATTRIERQLDIHTVSELAKTGVVVDLKTHTAFNSQNTAVLRDFVPAWFMMPGVGRMDDIYASLIVQRVMRERGYHVHFGRPFVWQQRNEHNLVSDLRKEIDGYENVEKLADLLDHIVLPGKSVIDDTRTIYSTLEHCDFIPKIAVEAAFAYLDDCEGVI